MSLRDELQRIYEDRQRLTPRDVVDVARDPQHPLHSRFEWDDSVAGPKWREQQARELIRSVRIQYIDRAGRPSDVRAFHAVRGPDGRSSYRPAEEIVENEVVTAVLLAEMEREWRQLRARWERFDEFRELVRRDVDAA